VNLLTSSKRAAIASDETRQLTAPATALLLLAKQHPLRRRIELRLAARRSSSRSPPLSRARDDRGVRPEDLNFTLIHPLPQRDHAALLASYHLLLRHVDGCLPVHIRSGSPTSFFEEWEITRATFIARMANTLRHLGYLAPSYSKLDGLSLARTLLDHVITFAWISADPRERVPAFLRTSFKSLLAKHNRAVDRGRSLLDEPQRKRLSDYTREVNRELPRLPRLAEEADAHWRERIENVLPGSTENISFQGLYSDIYDQYAEFDHPSTLGLQVFVHISGTPGKVTVDGRPERHLSDDLRPYRLAMWSFAEALVVSGLASGRPRLQPLRQTLETIANLWLLERDGRLVVDAGPSGTRISVIDGDGGP
jgi:hypothetical protein